MIFVYLILLLVPNYKCIVCDPKPGTPVLKPMGKGRGVEPGRVTWNWNRDGCKWDGNTDFWWSLENLNYTIVSDMLDESMRALTGESTSKLAWEKIFKDFNRKNLEIDKGYQTGEKIAIKLNLAVEFQRYQPKTEQNSISPQFLKALIHQLVDVAGVPQNDITAFDASRWIQVQFWDEPTGIGKLYPNVNLVDAAGGIEYTTKVEVDNSTNVYFSNHSVGGWNITKLPKCLTSAKYVIEVDGFRGHTLAGFTESGKNWFGSIYNPSSWNLCSSPSQPPKHWCPAFLHKWINVTGNKVMPIGGWLPQRPMKVYNPIVDLLGHNDTAAKGLIFFSDAMYGGLTQANTPPIKFQMEPFDNWWSCSVFASQDPIALDSVLFDFLRSDKATEKWPNEGCADNYLHEAALANDPPSKTVYAPSGKRLESLGVHEHWNNHKDKQYSRNLGVGDGIELIKVFEKKR